MSSPINLKKSCRQLWRSKHYSTRNHPTNIRPYTICITRHHHKPYSHEDAIVFKQQVQKTQRKRHTFVENDYRFCTSHLNVACSKKRSRGKHGARCTYHIMLCCVGHHRKAQKLSRETIMVMVVVLGCGGSTFCTGHVMYLVSWWWRLLCRISHAYDSSGRVLMMWCDVSVKKRTWCQGELCQELMERAER